jgi:phage FluMu protein Com
MIVAKLLKRDPLSIIDEALIINEWDLVHRSSRNRREHFVPAVDNFNISHAIVNARFANPPRVRCMHCGNLVVPIKWFSPVAFHCPACCYVVNTNDVPRTPEEKALALAIAELDTDPDFDFESRINQFGLILD